MWDVDWMGGLCCGGFGIWGGLGWVGFFGLGIYYICI